MTLYHFTAERFLKSIQASGLILGAIPMFDEEGKLKGFCPAYQWLTSNGAFDQEWSDGTGLLEYSRTEVRLDINIPDKKIGHLDKWVDFCKNPIFKNSGKELNTFGDPHNWYIYKGSVSPDFIGKVTFNPNYKTA